MTDNSARPVRHHARHAWAVWILFGCCLALSAHANGSELRNTPIVKAIQRARDAVVNIRGEKTIASPAGQSTEYDSARRVNGMGTGVVIDPRGYIMTNFHVVDGVREILCLWCVKDAPYRLLDGRIFPLLSTKRKPRDIFTFQRPLAPNDETAAGSVETTPSSGHQETASGDGVQKAFVSQQQHDNPPQL